ncbi:hypothetical protein BDB00DRAFT_908783, partial [Zychaea mexicana]|uniref:uncharacterized protein n=1 Tax=Zychaea mexicana TaxID=64656 RepID=UPI0022FEAE0B
LKVYGANAFGLNKLSITKRLEWVDQHFSEMLDLNSGLWRKADEPMLFLAFCFELQGYNKDLLNFISRLLIYLDATCNGVQHLAAMISDFDLASKVNLVESDMKDDPNDLYSLMLNPINEEIKKIEECDLEYARLKGLELNRKIVKRSLILAVGLVRQVLGCQRY